MVTIFVGAPTAAHRANCPGGIQTWARDQFPGYPIYATKFLKGIGISFVRVLNETFVSSFLSIVNLRTFSLCQFNLSS